jgi:uncharacterized protein
VTASRWIIGLALLATACRSEAEADPAASSRPDGPVLDQAEVLSAEVEQSLDRKLRRYWDQKDTAIVVVTVPNLKGRNIDESARDLFRELGIGSSQTNRGLLMLIAPNERKARIEVGCGLEAVVTDAVAAQIMDNIMVPRFAEGQFDAGANDGVNALITRVDTANVAAGPVSRYCVDLMKDAA